MIYALLCLLVSTGDDALYRRDRVKLNRISAGTYSRFLFVKIRGNKYKNVKKKSSTLVLSGLFSFAYLFFFTNLFLVSSLICLGKNSTVDHGEIFVYDDIWNYKKKKCSSRAQHKIQSLTDLITPKKEKENGYTVAI